MGTYRNLAVKLVLLRLVEACAAPVLPTLYAYWSLEVAVVQHDNSTSQWACSERKVCAGWIGRMVALALRLRCTPYCSW